MRFVKLMVMRLVQLKVRKLDPGPSGYSKRIVEGHIDLRLEGTSKVRGKAVMRVWFIEKRLWAREGGVMTVMTLVTVMTVNSGKIQVSTLNLPLHVDATNMIHSFKSLQS